MTERHHLGVHFTRLDADQVADFYLPHHGAELTPDSLAEHALGALGSAYPPKKPIDAVVLRRNAPADKGSDGQGSINRVALGIVSEQLGRWQVEKLKSAIEPSNRLDWPRPAPVQSRLFIHSAIVSRDVAAKLSYVDEFCPVNG